MVKMKQIMNYAWQTSNIVLAASMTTVVNFSSRDK